MRKLIPFATLGITLAFLPATASAEANPSHCILDLSAGTMNCDSVAMDVQASYVLSMEYDAPGFDGGSLTIVGDHPCSPSVDDVDYELPSLPPGADDMISSFRTWTDVPMSGLCYVQHFEDPDFQGRSIGPEASRADLGELDNQTSSIRWT